MLPKRGIGWAARKKTWTPPVSTATRNEKQNIFFSSSFPQTPRRTLVISIGAPQGHTLHKHRPVVIKRVVGNVSYWNIYSGFMGELFIMKCIEFPRYDIELSYINHRQQFENPCVTHRRVHTWIGNLNFSLHHKYHESRLFSYRRWQSSERKWDEKFIFCLSCLKLRKQWKEEDDTQEHTSTSTRMSYVKNETKSEMA